ncbi:hypothetical protein CPB86DRAFT_718726 [Serendipita vermifera]|nr:hypothetical protein CPB86DRAFT_718726 [Serendipita vermifera]
MPSPPPHSDLFEQACRLAIGTAAVRLDTLRYHSLQRQEDPEHTAALCQRFSTNRLVRGAHPIEVVLSGPVSDEWKAVVRATCQHPILPEGVYFVCIGGRHRVSAALQQIRKAYKDVEQLERWPAVIYDSRMLACPWLETFMQERNVPRLHKPTSEIDRLLALDRLAESAPEADPYSLLTTNPNAVKALREGCVWEAFMDLLRDPFLSSISKDIYIHWPQRWRMYPVMAMLFRDCVTQHQQLRARYRSSEVQWTMESLYGTAWEKNQVLSKTGHRAEVDALLEKQGGPQQAFNVENYEEWWNVASRRINASNGASAGDVFYFGSDWVRVLFHFDLVRHILAVDSPWTRPSKSGSLPAHPAEV